MLNIDPLNECGVSNTNLKWTLLETRGAINLILSGIYFYNSFGSGSITFNWRFVTIVFSSGPGINKKVATPNGLAGRINITMVNIGDMRMMMRMVWMMAKGVATSIDGCGRPC